MEEEEQCLVCDAPRVVKVLGGEAKETARYVLVIPGERNGRADEVEEGSIEEEGG
jgi:hypothetical protein